MQYNDALINVLTYVLKKITYALMLFKTILTRQH